ncbi:unnamed protein product [Rotaria magnacalcarata]|uniref:Uncharacterized protein n=1 Tax=Rotaria magnacalcarata TaxID=392030 RepID=A0A816ZE76_9BILA|nr:unnamed protein product [Rotaria magnacalcarata]CAF1676451.1 unnamed protein product [Rotaria magnacalcarata]CAF2052762.1 unnamed protein product [Rotaria magnacalcarata]CAF2200511.1 unnamed protein product [Rotaria magnacalcarata]CAF3759965.1 unnamed protein product [Rotaria magnacalcarata]
MKICYNSSFIFYAICFSLLPLSFAFQRSKIDSTTTTTTTTTTIIDDDDSKTELNNENELESIDDEYIDESKYNKASYQHEQELLANIYAPNRTFISMHDDRIHPSNFSYFTFNRLGTYRFILISLRGDADLYISTRHKYVTYDNYEYSSCTCGIDEILTDYNIKRPIYIGIYGYSRYQTSHYRLLIELVDTKISMDETIIEQSNNDQLSMSSQEQQRSPIDRKNPSVTIEGEEGRLHLLWNIFLWILNFLVEVLA